ncbi:MAG: oxidoreductase domain protein [Chthoniobacteraceae bacterium]|nr:oxidoreductase domain protein [Chthoniobacteraceae bacterium]MDB6171329.1 oxidoreductase domain protein [Chthoniobacteraceae bacterium]
MNSDSPQIITLDSLSRRNFLKRGSAAVAGTALLGALAPERFALGASSNDTIKIALIGCGGRGSGAANQALNTYSLGPVKLVAMADAHEDRLQSSLSNLQKTHADRVDVPKERQFIGFEAYKEAIAQCDVAILSTPPGFRPIHFEEAVRQGKNIFMEKPVASDAAGVRQVLAAAVEAKKKNLKIGVGLQRHHQDGYIETLKRIHDGAIGDVVSMNCYWNGSRPWQKKRSELEKQYGRPLTEMEYQLRNWYYFTWIGGDHIVEQHIHNIDVINWVKKGPPVKARAMGGREITTSPDDGEIYDHFACEFDYADGSTCYSYCRHQPNTWNSVSEHVVGTKGRSDVSGNKILGENQWRYKAENAKDPYQQEHDDLFKAIRENREYSEIDYGASSTMTAILGRMAAYSGKEIDYEAALNSKISIMPKSFAWDAAPLVQPGPDGYYPKAIPGKTVVL